jgi:hypothetical protein
MIAPDRQRRRGGSNQIGLWSFRHIGFVDEAPRTRNSVRDERALDVGASSMERLLANATGTNRRQSVQVCPDNAEYLRSFSACSCTKMREARQWKNQNRSKNALNSEGFIRKRVFLERWPSGRRRSPAKGVGPEGSRGFESLPLRHFPLKFSLNSHIWQLCWASFSDFCFLCVTNWVTFFRTQGSARPKRPCHQTWI